MASKHRLWSTPLLNVVAVRDAAPACAWLAQSPEQWRAAIAWIEELATTVNDRTYCSKNRRLGRFHDRWAPQIAAWRRSRASNGLVEAIIVESPYLGVVDVANEAA